jgi:cytochrome c biogenesis protein CcmG, thiol:disulfide interchange protein DsbE
LRLIALALSLLVAMTTASAGADDASPPSPAPRWQVLESYAGKVVLLDFWASWCSPCLQSFPWMNELQKRHGGEGLVVVAVNLDQDRTLAEAFLGKTPAKFRVEYDPAGAVARQFDVQAMPTSFLIGRDGRVRARHAGFKDKHRAARERQIEQLLKEPAA